MMLFWRLFWRLFCWRWGHSFTILYHDQKPNELKVEERHRCKVCGKERKLVIDVSKCSISIIDCDGENDTTE